MPLPLRVTPGGRDAAGMLSRLLRAGRQRRPRPRRSGGRAEGRFGALVIAERVDFLAGVERAIVEERR